MKTGEKSQEDCSEPEEKPAGLASQPSKNTTSIDAGGRQDTANLRSTADGLVGISKHGPSEGRKIVTAPTAASAYVDFSHKRKREDARRFYSPTKLCVHRILCDLNDIQREPLDGILVELDEDCNNLCHALIIGPTDTPYELGMFQFLLEFPNDYPYVPPEVTLLTTDGGRVQFNSCLHASGRVCLSILGPRDESAWSSVQTIGSLLMSIRSVLQEYPLLNVPSFGDIPTSSRHVIDYNQHLRHETLRVAVVGFIEEVMLYSSQHVQRPQQEQLAHYLPTRLVECAKEHFLEYVESYKYMCDEYSFLDGRQHYDIFSFQPCTFQFRHLKQRIEQVVPLVQPGDVTSAAMPKEVPHLVLPLADSSTPTSNNKIDN
jgi:ubiquitin-conjugating enzyme E2 Z